MEGRAPKFLDRRILLTPDIALGGARQECLRMANLGREMLADAMHVFLNDDTKPVPHVRQTEELVDSLEKEITTYLAELSQHSLTKRQSKEVSALMYAVNDLERIGDHAENVWWRNQSCGRAAFSERPCRNCRKCTKMWMK